VADYVAVNANADPDAQGLERIQCPFMKERSVGLNPAIYLNASFNGSAYFARSLDDGIRSSEQRLAAMKDDPNGSKTVITGVFGDPLRYDGDKRT
jgi:hypothetical protein